MSTWEELNNGDQTKRIIEKKEYDDTVTDLKPVILREEGLGAKPVVVIDFQPILSKGFYEAEFAMKGNDVIFHFWPDRYHEAERSELPTPTFPKDFEVKLKAVLGDVFGAHRVEMSMDADIGAWFAKAFGYGTHEYARKLSIEVCEKLHKDLGGEV